MPDESKAFSEKQNVWLITTQTKIKSTGYHAVDKVNIIMPLASIYATTLILHYTIDQCHTQNIVVINIMDQMPSRQLQQTCHHTGVHLCML